MLNILFARLYERILVKRTQMLESSLDNALNHYSQVLNQFGDASQSLLCVLLARDHVECLVQKAGSLPIDRVHRLVTLDKRLYEEAMHTSLKDLVAWRQSLLPSDTHWWWFLDKDTEQKEEKKAFLPILVVTP